MKVEQKECFSPVSITLETLQEVKDIRWAVAGDGYVNGIENKPIQFLTKKLEEIIKKTKEN